MQAVILCGGKGTRLAPYTYVFPKPMMPIANDLPIMEVIIRQLKRHGFKEIILAVGYKSDLIKSYFKDGSKWNVKLKYSYEKKPLGTAGALSLLKNMDSDFLVMNGDELTDIGYGGMMKEHKTNRSDITIASYEVDVTIRSGVLEPDGLGGSRIIRYVEKPIYKHQQSMGIYCINPAMLGFLRHGETADFPEFVNKVIKQGCRVEMYKFCGTWLDMGIKEDYEAAVKLFAKEREWFIY